MTVVIHRAVSQTQKGSAAECRFEKELCFNIPSDPAASTS
jgi:hypothetical protein